MFLLAVCGGVSQAKESTFSLVKPFIPSSERCELAQEYISETLLPVKKNIYNYEILGNCALKKGDVELAKAYWSKAAILGSESSLINIGMITSLDPISQHERFFGLAVLKKVGQQNLEEKSMSKLFGALMLVSYPYDELSDNEGKKLETIATLLLQAAELEKEHNIHLSSMVIRYLFEIGYFDKTQISIESFGQVIQIAKETKPYYCYMSEVLERDLYKLPQRDEVTQRYKHGCENE